MSDDDKKAAALAALDEVAGGMIVGLGTGSTAHHAVIGLGERVRAGLDVRAVATSAATDALARANGIAMLDFADVAQVGLTIDGADEIDARLYAVKGAGGAMLREKAVAAASRRMVVIADASKRVARIGAARVPVEIIPFAWASTLALLGDDAVPRRAGGSLYRTDNGNLVADCRFDLSDPIAVAARLDAIPGVMAHGLFLAEVDAAYVADRSVVTRLERRGASG